MKTNNKNTTDRTIKFKFWDTKNNRWLADGSAMSLDHSGRYNTFLFDNDNYDIPEEGEWVQFTGLLDKNGVEIYEGDIIRDENDKYERENVYVVEWDDNWAAFIIKRRGSNLHETEMVNSLELAYECEDCQSVGQRQRERRDYYNWKVVGNIYENPDLLTTSE